MTLDGKPLRPRKLERDTKSQAEAQLAEQVLSKILWQSDTLPFREFQQALHSPRAEQESQ